MTETQTQINATIASELVITAAYGYPTIYADRTGSKLDHYCDAVNCYFNEDLRYFL